MQISQEIYTEFAVTQMFLTSAGGNPQILITVVEC